MSAEPKPIGDIHACDECGNFHDPAYSDCATGEPIIPKPTGEWTAERVYRVVQCCGHDGLAQEINAELAAAKAGGWLSQEALDEYAKVEAEHRELQQHPLVEEIAFWTRMFVRAKHGCVARDCLTHGGWSPNDLERINSELEKVKVEK